MSAIGWLKDLFTGKRPAKEESKVQIEWEVCKSCDGSGRQLADFGRTKIDCDRCAGKGKVEVAIFPDDGDPKWMRCRMCQSPTTKKAEDGWNLYRCTKCGWQLEEIVAKGEPSKEDECPRCSGLAIKISEGHRECIGYPGRQDVERAYARFKSKPPKDLNQIPPCGWSGT